MFKKIVINSIFAATLISAGNVIADPTPTTMQAYYQAQSYGSITGTVSGANAVMVADDLVATSVYFERYEYPAGHRYYKVDGIPTIPSVGWSTGANCGDVSILNSWFDNSGYYWEQSLTVPALANNQSGTATYVENANWWQTSSFEVTCHDGIVSRSY